MSTSTEMKSVLTTNKPITGQESYNASKTQMSQIVNGPPDGNKISLGSALTGLGSSLDIKI